MADRILIVEDERITAEDLREVLTGLGYDVTAAVSNGREAIAEAERNPPDLALMDIRIQGAMDGTETATILREQFDIPVIFLTAHADRATLDRAKQSKPVGYVVKPYQESELQASVEIALHKHRVDRQAKSRHRQLTEVLSAMILGIVSVDLNEHVLVFNPAAEDLTGWSESDALHRPVRRVFRLADLATGRETDLPLRDAMQGNILTEFRDKLLITRTGERIRIEGNIAPVRGPGGGISGVVMVFESVTESAENPFLRTPAKTPEKHSTLQFGRFHVVAASDKMRQALEFALRVARSEASVVLLEGESGTGKDLIAQFLHYSGNRASRPFVPINCSAIPDTLLESELFGHEPGAFSDARTQKKGLFEMAHGGTLFLDEIGEMSPAVQTKLLRVLETQSFRRLGGVRDIEVDVRVVSATNRYLADAVHAERFRLDLFHRLSIIQITLPPLRDRPEDILPMASHFVQEFALKYKAKLEGIAAEAARMLEVHDWPGNVRELRNVIERAVLSESTDMIQAASIRFVSGGQRMRMAPHGDLSLKDSQRSLILQALEKTGGNKTRAAALLGISRDVLRYRMNRLKPTEGPK